MGFMAPVVEHFRGKPAAVPGSGGLIVYTFPELLGDKSASVLGIKEARQSLPPLLEEGSWTFSNRSSREMLIVIALGVVNLIGSFWLYKASQRGGSLAWVIGPWRAHFFGILAYWSLLPYAVLFLLIPLGRAASQELGNRGVKMRNGARKSHAAHLEELTKDKGSALQSKIFYASSLRRKMQSVPAGRIAASAV